jgi:anaerobic ribonucleoside-triphosphate reductase
VTTLIVLLFKDSNEAEQKLNSQDLEQIYKNMVKKKTKNYESLYKLIDYFLVQNELDKDPSMRSQQIRGKQFSISFREFISIIDDSYLIKVRVGH